MSDTKTDDATDNPGKLPEDGTSKGATPAGLGADELRRRANKPGPRDDGGTG
ncbi:hypothetical protein [Roseiterribacter gracilis]|uniref:Uncharacterized protein n=1 Tax=Roseiterribacter gracilis TaxID=2812848 RepID=A0A8S8XCB2_9PROT|nr:hypothetical protein TMPK1_38750 [Rhodospirillales bacterium TMPK1]